MGGESSVDAIGENGLEDGAFKDAVQVSDVPEPGLVA
jgi:hypothetical protein